MNKKALTETDIRTKFIMPALVGPKGERWNVMTQIREEAHPLPRPRTRRRHLSRFSHRSNQHTANRRTYR